MIISMHACNKMSIKLYYTAKKIVEYAAIEAGLECDSVRFYEELGLLRRVVLDC